ncbi:SusC/RagA family TonB-linked outer membrane protein [Bacteroidia bacterium]|nr:SusC/RagA family TonB-linked outer membrane protein [Bacteroidia bacterium]
MCSQSLFAQTVTGKVTDNRGEELVGVSVTVKGTQTGTISDLNGEFSVQAQTGQILVFSYPDFKTMEEPIGDTQKTLQITLQKNIIDIDEVVVIGYGNVKKRDLTGSVASIKSDELLQSHPTGINQALQGKIAGVVVSQSDGAPGAGITIQVRGANSFTTTTEPLYVVDGIPFNVGGAPATDYGMKQANNPLNMINPKDIESIEILKDASATAIYGSRGANGVVLITTKRGSEGKAKVDFSANFGISKIAKNIGVLDASQYAEYRNELVINGYTYDGKSYVDPTQLPFPGVWTQNSETGKSTYLPSPADYRNGYDNGGRNWQDEIYQTAFSQDYNLTLSGGDAKGSYLISGGVLDQQGIILNSYYKRYSLRASINRQIRNWLELGGNISVTKSDNRFARTSTENYGITSDAMRFNPTLPKEAPDQASGYSEDYGNGLSNPYLYATTAKNLVGTTIISESGYANIKFTDYLSFRQNVGYWGSTNKRDQYYNRYVAGGVSPTNGYGIQADNYYSSLTTESMLTFYKNFGKNHHLDAVAGWTYEITDWGGKSMSAKDFPNDMNEEWNMGAATNPDPLTSDRGQSRLMSFLGRFNYILMDKYLLTASFRRDGSSRLANNRWGNFGSVAFAYRLSEEEFIKNLGIFDNLKLRLSYGQTGNQGINAYATRSRMVAFLYPYNNSLSSGYAEDRWGGPAAPNLKWETTSQYNVGLDIGVLKNRVNFVIDYYEKHTKDLLQYQFIPQSTGANSIATNYGSVYNKGLEITGNFYPIDTRDFKWKLDANISFNKNEIRDLDADQFSDVAWGIESVFLRRNGEAIGLLYAYKEDGFFDNEAEVRANPVYKNESDSKVQSMIGQVKYKDTDENGVIDDRDKVIVGNTNPNFIYGITNTFTYKNFSLSFFLQGTKGNDILNVNLYQYDMASTTNMPAFVYNNRWTAENKQNAEFPRADNTYTRSMKASDRLVEDGSYLRLKNLTFGYQFKPPSFIKEISMINLTVGVNNLFTITKYRWFDPDVNTFGSDASRRGVDMNSYPASRTFNFGVQVFF